MIREETQDDLDAVRALTDAAFGQPNEGRLVDRLRAGGLVVVALVAIRDGRIVGNVVFSKLPITARAGTIDAVALAPVAVAPEYQRRGVGTALINEGLRICRARGIAAALVLGDASYYVRFGFSSDAAAHIKGPYAGPAWQALELEEGALRGVEGGVTYPAAFEEVE